MRCRTCISFQKTAKRFSDNKKAPKMSTEDGTRFRSEILNDHLNSPVHIECVKLNKQKTLQESSNIPVMAIDVHISRANEEMANRIGKLMIHVFGDAKRLTLPAWNFPSRIVASEAGHRFKFNQAMETVPGNINLNYVNPPSHLILLTDIVESDRQTARTKILECRSISLRIDGSVDRQQLDKIFVMAKIVTQLGKSELVFLGVADQMESGAIGLFKAAKSAITLNFGEEILVAIFKKLSSICTDGAPVNRGDKQSLWLLLDDEMRKYGSNIPLTKIWCAAHRADLVWSDLKKDTREVEQMLSTLSSISSYFHISWLRMNNLQAIAKQLKLNLRSFPKLFEVRWTEYTFRLVNNILISWNVLVIYFESQKEKDASASGFFSYLIKYENLKLICFIGDVLLIYSRFHKKMQRNNLTIVSMIRHVDGIKSLLNKIKLHELVGGYEGTLKSSLEHNDGRLFLKNVEIDTGFNFGTRSSANGNFDKIRSKTIECLLRFLTERFELSDEFDWDIIDFLEFKEEVDIVKMHNMFAADLSLCELNMQYQDLVLSNDFPKNTLSETIQVLSSEALCHEYSEILTTLARIQAITPHAADVERLISSNNILRSSHRYSLKTETQNKYLYVHFNMPVLSEWDPRPAVTTFLSKTHRSRSVTVDDSKAKKQEYFNGIFENVDTNNNKETESDMESGNIKFSF